jgi:hypothetical protein
MLTKEPLAFRDELLPMLREAAAEQRLRSRRGRLGRPILLLAAAVGAAIVVSASVAGGHGAEVTVSGVDALREPAAVEGTLRDAGIDARIVEVPVRRTSDHQWEGAWWWVGFDRATGLSEDDFDELRSQTGLFLGPAPIDSSDYPDPTELTLPKGLPGHVRLFVGREVPHGSFSVNEYDSMNELSPTGSFYCLGLDPADPVSVGAAIRQLGFDITWRYESLIGNTDRQVATPPTGTAVMWAWLTGPSSVEIRVADVGPDADEYRHAEGTFLPSERVPWAPPCN